MLLVVGLWVLHETSALNTTSQCIYNASRPKLDRLKPKSTFRHLKQGIQDFHRKYVLVPADKAANNVVFV